MSKSLVLVFIILQLFQPIKLVLRSISHGDNLM